MNKKYCSLICFSIIIAFSCNRSQQNNSNSSDSSHIIFEDKFDADSQGEYEENVIQLPPPDGLLIKWKVLPGGHKPINWILSDAMNPEDPKKGLWVIPPDSGYIQQGGRSHNSVLFAGKPIPEHTVNYDIEFKQKRTDNDKIMYLLGATNPDWKWTIEIGYEIQFPGTDSTTNNAFILGSLGESMVVGAAFHHTWANHKIEVRGENVRWTCNKILMAEGKIQGLKPGYFGIRHRYERNTLYDDVKISWVK